MPVDQLVTVPGSGTAPLTYQIAAAQEIILKAAFASFDGSGAATPFLPCLRILSPSGQVVGEYVTDSSVAAGSSAEVTFAPFLRNAAAAAGGGITQITSTGGTVTVTNPFGPVTNLETVAGGGTGLPNAVMIKTNTQTVAGNTVTQVGMDSTTFKTTDGSIFTASGSNIVINKDGLYASYIHYVPDTVDTDPAQTQFFAEWITAGGGANAPWEQIVPRNFNVNGPAGLPGFQPDGSALAHSIANLSLAYCSAQPSSVKVFMATLTAASVQLSTCLHVVVQIQPIAGATLAGYPSYPF